MGASTFESKNTHLIVKLNVEQLPYILLKLLPPCTGSRVRRREISSSEHSRAPGRGTTRDAAVIRDLFPSEAYCSTVAVSVYSGKEEK